MARQAHELALRSWVELATGLPNNAVRFFNSRPNAPSKGKPFATVRVISEAGEGDPDSYFRSVDDVFVIEEVTEGLVSVQFFGDDHALLAKRLETSLANPLIQEFFDKNGVVVTRSGGTAATYNFQAYGARIEDRSERVFVFRRAITTEITGIEPIESFEPEPTFE